MIRTLSFTVQNIVWCLIFFVLGLLAYALPAVDYFSAVPGVFGDDRFNSVILEHLFRWASGREPDLWSPTYFYPFQHALAFSDNHFGSAIFYIFLRFLGFSREISFDGWFLIGIVLSFTCSCLAFRWMGFSSLATAVASFIFCFSIPALRSDVNAQLIYRFATPLAFAAFWHLLTQRRLLLLGQVFFWVSLQFFCSIYLGVFLCYLLIATLLAWFLAGKKKHFLPELLSGIRKEKRETIIVVIAVALVSISLLAWLLFRYYEATLEYPLGQNNLFPIFILVRLSSYFSPDNLMFIGLGVWAVCLLGIVQTFQKDRNDKIGLIALVTFVTLVAVTLYVRGYSLYYLLFNHLPGISAIRAVPRIVLVMLLPLAILAAFGVDVLKKRTNMSLTKKLFMLIVLFALLGTEVVAFQPRNVPIRQWKARKERLLEKMPIKIPDDAILYVTMKKGEPFYMAELDGMILGQDLGFPTLNGYSGNVPPGYVIADPCFSAFQRLQGYALSHKLQPGAMEALVRRVITVSPDPCTNDRK